MPPWPVPQLIAWIERVETQAARATMFELLEVPSSADTKAVQTAFLRVAAGAHPDLHRHTLPPSDAERLMRAYAKVAAAYDTLRDQRTRDKYRKEIQERGRPPSPAPVIGGAQPAPRPGSSAPPLGPRASGSSPPGLSVPRTTTSPAIARTTTPPNVARTTTSPSVARTTPPPEVAAGSASGFGRTTGAMPAARSPSKSPDERPPLITAPPVTASPVTAPRTPSATAPRTKPPSRPPAMTTPGSASRGPGESRPPGSGLGGRAQVYFRKAQSCLNRGDLGGALFNLRLAAAADPSSSVIRVALAEVEAELGTKK